MITGNHHTSYGGIMRLVRLQSGGTQLYSNCILGVVCSAMAICMSETIGSLLPRLCRTCKCDMQTQTIISKAAVIGTQLVEGFTEGNAMQVGDASGASGRVILVDDGVMAENNKTPGLSVSTTTELLLKIMRSNWGKIIW